MEWVVTTGRTVEEAREAALDQLGVDEHDAEVEVLQEPQKGLFGRVRVEAQVRARVRPSAPPPKVDRRDRRRRQRGREGERAPRNRARAGTRTGGAGSTGGSPGSAASAGPAGHDRQAARLRADGAQGAADGSDGDRSRSSGAGGSGGQGSGQGAGQARKRRRRSRRGGKAEGARVVSDSATETAAATAVDVAAADIEAQRQAVEAFLRGLADAFGRSDATVSVTVSEDDDETLDATIDGPELGLLVGQKGVTLQSLHELVRSMVQRRFVGESHARIRLDVAGYRERRRVALERFTISVAESVRETGVAKALDPMGAADRKVVHDAVNTIDGVETVSEGENADRHVVIRPVS